MSLQLHLFQHPEDGWTSVLKPWLKKVAKRVLEGEDVWLITPGRLAAHWIRQRWSATGRPWFGIRTLEPWSLRRELAARLNHPYEPLGRESLELLLVLQARNHLARDPLAPRVATSPGTALCALDELGRAGWLSQDKAIQETGLAPWLHVLEKTNGWLPALDHKLLNSPRQETDPRLHLFFWGWDSQQQDHWLLLLAALRQATTATITSPAPRFEGRETEQPWLEFLSQHFQQPFHDCPAASHRNPTPLNPFPLASASPAQAIEAILAALRDPIETGERTAIALEPTSPLGPVLRSRLRQLAIPFYDDLGIPKPATPCWTVRRAWITYHAADGALSTFLSFWHELVYRLRRDLTPPLTLDSLLRRALANAQTTRLPTLLNHPAADGVRKAIDPLLPHVKPWPETLTWDQTVQLLTDFDQAIGADPNELQPLVGRLKRLLGNASLPRTDLLRFLASGLEEGGVFRHPNENNPFAPLILTTRRNALDQSWNSIAFTDANEGIWPQTPSENPFLPDDLRAHLNRKRPSTIPHLLTLRDQAARERDQTARLIDACSTRVALSFLTQDPTEPQIARFPNELAARWQHQNAPSSFPPPPATPTTILDSSVLATFTRVHASRRDPNQPFDEYSWVVGKLPGNLPPWNPSSLDKLRSQPTAFFLKWFYQAEPTWGQPWERQVNAAIGTLAHRWLAIACNDLESPDWPKLESRLKKAYQSDHTKAPKDPWWHGVFAQAWFYARAMASAIPSLAKGYHLRTEVPLSAVSVSGTTLALKGKADLVLEGAQGLLHRIIDFKTGTMKDPPKLAQLLKPNGSGLQFAGYLWLLSEPNKEIEVGIVFNDGTWHPVVTTQDLSELQPVLDSLAQIRDQGIFSRNPDFQDSFLQPEPIPFACPRWSNWLLKRKAGCAAPAPNPTQDSSEDDPS
ncbi:MAG: hypothetical protein OHK005_16870 [Candidatus Methylacidiphilales bacterium]